MNIHPIRTEAEYRAILTEVSALVDGDPDPDTPAGERLNALASLVQAYEALCAPGDAGFVDRLRSLTAGVEIDLDQPLPPEINDSGMP
jgi:antitoxin component HigA of HigAB toxin-antitoxin module